MRTRLFAAVAVPVVLAGAVVATFALRAGEAHHRAAPPAVLVSTGDQLLPSATLTDWVTYADQLVLATVARERRLAPTGEESQAGEGFVPRVIELRIDRVLWSRTGAPAAPASFETDLDGWQFHGTKRTPVRLRGEPMMSVGRQYVLPIVHLDRTKRVSVAGWCALSPDSIFPYRAGVLGRGDVIPSLRAQGRSTPTDARGPFYGRSPARLVAALDATRPDPAASGGMTLPPDERFRRATRASASN
ncbi:hypothetical protein AB0I55_06455 [Actinocatenispora sera]|uniref:Uncharacterized protein n=1 Tax=Actinocatenispora sera TaxID=390989 RepID=A0A810LCD3_9ACTN|nr:hypothetical protein [Actinocatenispora sera]BCJ32222.1 hypothetical protein Asera_63300 [Actinocatenispora sera]